MEMHLRAMAFVLAFTFAAFGSDNQEPAGQQVPSCIVSVAAYDKAGKVLHRGVGLFVSESGDVVALADLVEGANRVEITAQGKQYPLTRLIAKDAGSGMVLFSVAFTSQAARPARVGRSVPSLGDKVQAVALNDRFEPSIISGTVKTRDQVAKWESLGIDAGLPGRSLGSPVFNEDGELVGVISHQSPGESSLVVYAGEGISYMVKALLGSKKLDSGQNIPGASPETGPLSTRGIHHTGVVQGQATRQVAPEYPRSAKEYHITGTVTVEITIDETGRVTAANAIGGRFNRPMNVSEDKTRQIIPQLNKAAVEAALKWRFEPTRLSGVPVKVIGSVTFNFLM